MKSLKNYMDTMVQEKRKPKAVTLPFFLKSRSAKGRAELRNVRLKLQASQIRPTLQSILRDVGLPTSYVDSLPAEETALSEDPIDPFADDAFEAHIRSAGKPSTDLRHPLNVWLDRNVTTARERLAHCEPIRLEIERIQGELCHQLNMTDILWECGWETSHRRGALDSFRFVANNHQELMPVLATRTLVFGNQSGVSLDGHVILNSGEVRYNWLHIIRTVPENDRVLRRIPLVEKSLSESLRGIRIVHRKFQPITLVDDYRTRLRKLVTSVNDYRAKKMFPEEWPEELKNLELCVESEASPLMLSPTGQFIVPASCPGFLLVNFITENIAAAIERLGKAESQVRKENELIIRCMNELGLIQLDRDDSIGSEAMIDCCERLLQNASGIRHLTHGNHLVVTRYYSVVSDGTICIPWNWKDFE